MACYPRFCSRQVARVLARVEVRGYSTQGQVHGVDPGAHMANGLACPRRTTDRCNGSHDRRQSQARPANQHARHESRGVRRIILCSACHHHIKCLQRDRRWSHRDGLMERICREFRFRELRVARARGSDADHLRPSSSSTVHGDVCEQETHWMLNDIWLYALAI